MNKVALFLPNLRGGGAERMMINLANGMSEAGVAVALVLCSVTQGSYLKEVSAAVELVDLGHDSMIKSFPALTRYLRAERPDVLISTLQYANVAALLAHKLAGGGTKIFVREANVILAGRSSSRKERLVRTLVKWLYPQADGVIAVSEGVAASIAAFVKLEPDKVTTIYNPVVSSELKSLSERFPEHDWYQCDTPIVLGTGRLARQKDFATLIRAFARLRAQSPMRLIILGEGEERPALEALAAELGVAEDVSLPGFVANPFAFMAHSAAFVLSSAWEGLPGVLIQALACGCPVISTDCPSGPAEILDNGRYGRLVPVGDDASLAEAIAETLRTPLAAEVLRRRGADFSVEAAVRTYVRVLGLRAGAG